MRAPWAALLRRLRQPRAADAARLSVLLRQAAPVDLQIFGRTLLHAAAVGLAAGLVGAAFFAGLEYLSRLLLEDLTGYTPLRAYGESFAAAPERPHTFRPWLLVILPAVGALLGGLASRLAPETRGGGGDAMIDAFHHHGGVIRPRVAWVKMLASLLTLGTGGSGGREGPTMQVGGALGSLVGGFLRVSPRERRVLMVAGVAAGISAVFRTPLGAAILAVEVLYRDDFEAEALIPAVLASVIAYSVVISIYGESILFARAPRYPFVPAHLPLYLLLAIFISLLATLFVTTLRFIQRMSARLPLAAWLRPTVGGLALGVFALPLILLLGHYIGAQGQGLGILGGGYGAAQMAITGSPWLPAGWPAVILLTSLCFAKLIASSLTIGTGGSAGDFAPSLVLGGLLGGAFGRAASLLLGDPRLDPGAFALVGMGTFYGGIAHVPVSALILVSELAGSYDLLVPLMLSIAVAFLLLRRRSLYESQPRAQRDSPVHRATNTLDVLATVPVREVVTTDRRWLQFDLRTPVREILGRASDYAWQDVFPVVDGNGALRGLITGDTLRFFASDRAAEGWAIAADVMQPAVTIDAESDLRTAAERMIGSGLRELPVVDAEHRIIGFLDEAEVARAYLGATAKKAGGSSAS